jgi:hypothetical protein
MTALNPDHLLDQADQLIVPPPAGAPRQANLRRAVSNAYYAMFHFVIASAADEFVGVTQRNSARYALMYRCIDHRVISDVCQEVKKTQPSAKFVAYIPQGGFGSQIVAFASAIVDLQQRRHQADYDPTFRLKLSDANLSIATARTAIRRLKRAKNEQRKMLLTLLICRPR